MKAAASVSIFSLRLLLSFRELFLILGPIVVLLLSLGIVFAQE